MGLTGTVLCVFVFCLAVRLLDRRRLGMRQWIRSQLTYANVVATLALFVALGGGTALASYVISSNKQVGPGTISGHKPPRGGSRKHHRRVDQRQGHRQIQRRRALQEGTARKARRDLRRLRWRGQDVGERESVLQRLRSAPPVDLLGADAGQKPHRTGGELGAVLLD